MSPPGPVSFDDGPPVTAAEKLGRLMEGMDELKREVRENIRPALHEIRNKLQAVDNIGHALEETRAEAKRWHIDINARVISLEMWKQDIGTRETEQRGRISGLKLPFLWFMAGIGALVVMFGAVGSAFDAYDAIVGHWVSVP